MRIRLRPTPIGLVLLSACLWVSAASAQVTTGAERSSESPFQQAEPEDVRLSSDAIADLAELVRGWTRDTLVVGAEILVVKDSRAAALELVHDGGVRVELSRAEPADGPDDEAAGSDTLHVVPPTDDTSEVRRVVTVVKGGTAHDPRAIQRALGVEPCCE